MARVREILLPWDSRPQEAVGVDWSNPLTRGLGFVAIGGVPINLVNNKLGTLVGAASVVAAEKGLAFSTNDGVGDRVDFVGAMAAPTEATYASLFLNDGTSSNQQYLINKDAAGGIFNLLSIINSTQIQVVWGGGAAHVVTTPSTVNVWSLASASTPPAGSLTGTDATFWFNGRKISPLSTTNGAHSFPGGDVVLSGRTSDNARNFGGLQALSVVWSRVLSDVEHAEFQSNPWQLFAPRSIWVPVSAGGGAATHATTGVLTGAGSTVAGTAAHKAKHATTGVLTGPGSAVVGSAARTRQHPTSGALTGAGSAVVGSAARTRQHPSSGTLVGTGSAVVGVAAHVVAGGPHATTGALVGAGSVVVGTAAHKAKHATSGVLAGAGSTVVGDAARIAGAVTHETSGVLVGPGALIVGVARGPLPDVVSSGGGGWLPNMRRKTRKQIHEERIKLGILPPDVVKAAKKAAAVVVAEKPEPVKAYKADPEQANKVFLRELGVSKMLPDYTRAIQAQIKVMQQEEDDLLAFM